MRSRFVSLVCKILEPLLPLEAAKIIGVDKVCKTLWGHLCVFTPIPRIHACSYEDFKYVHADMCRGPILKELPRGIGRIFVQGLKTKAAELVASYESFAGAEAVVGSEVWDMLCAMTALSKAVVWQSPSG